MLRIFCVAGKKETVENSKIYNRKIDRFHTDKEYVTPPRAQQIHHLNISNLFFQITKHSPLSSLLTISIWTFWICFYRMAHSPWKKLRRVLLDCQIYSERIDLFCWWWRFQNTKQWPWKKEIKKEDESTKHCVTFPNNADESFDMRETDVVVGSVVTTDLLSPALLLSTYLNNIESFLLVHGLSENFQEISGKLDVHYIFPITD